MSFLVEILEKVGLKKVKTYIQSGNVILERELSKGETVKLIHDTIAKEIGADLSVIIKKKINYRQLLRKIRLMKIMIFQEYIQYSLTIVWEKMN